MKPGLEDHSALDHELSTTLLLPKVTLGTATETMQEEKKNDIVTLLHEIDYFLTSKTKQKTNTKLTENQCSIAQPFIFKVLYSLLIFGQYFL